MVFDMGTNRCRVTAVTLVEDAAHPESWLRDCGFEFYDSERKVWNPAASLLSDAPIHTHRLQAPVESTRFRLRLPCPMSGNLRLGEVVLHGEVSGTVAPERRNGRQGGRRR